ncbi:hypothetical protein AK812_SmicGene13876 [Symbiodinium microadriaticum]|uniref:Uncharacterized protein n=1 Tax=Symbiodinium microadriaticum TaxID=2951 RepID=A0A1Q9E6Z9_SYMMI|nr:hypothetical protein AK812_SmicGene13876 [Symbiodinium microadriaticum]CAE7212752.1 unnamed protein product [Symbiodinium sp. KB8]
MAVKEAQEIRKAYRLAASLHLRRLLRSWQSVSRVRSVADACKRLPEVPQLIVKYQKYQQQQMAKFIHQRMLRLRAACMSRANWVRCMARAGKKALHEWQRVSRMSALERSVSYQERTHWQSWLRHAFESFVKVAASAKVVRSKALDLQKRWLARALLAFQEATRCSKAFRHRCRAAQATFRKHQLERSMNSWNSWRLSQRQQRLMNLDALSSWRRCILNRALGKLCSFTMLRARCRGFTTKRRQDAALKALKSLRQTVLLSRRSRAAKLLKQASVLRHVLRQWTILHLTYSKLGLLGQVKQFRFRQILFNWWRGCNLSDILRCWHWAGRMGVKERHAIAQHTQSSWRFIQSVLQEWRAFAKLLREEQGYLRYRCNLTRLRCCWKSWNRRVTAVHLMQRFRDKQRLVSASSVVKGWSRQVACRRHTTHLVQKRGLQLCKRSISCWRAHCMARQAASRLQSQVVLAWLDWAALRRQVRDDVAWQRWAEGVADIFISRRLLRGLPTCFSTWCHSVRQQSALHARAAAMQTDASRQLLVFTFGTLRCILALRRLQRFDSEKCLRELRACFVNLRWSCQMSAKAGTVQATGRGFRKAQAFTALLRIYQRRCSAKSMAAVMTRNYLGRAFCRLRQFQHRMEAIETSAKLVARRYRLLAALARWRKELAVQMRKTWLPAVFVEWRQIAQRQRLRRLRQRRYGLLRWRAYVKDCRQQSRRAVLADLLRRRRQMRAVLLPWQLAAASKEAGQLQDRWSEADVVPGLQQFAFMRYRDATDET